MRGNLGEPLPAVWQSLQAAGTVFRRGQLALIAAGPGTGKSAFTLTLALLCGLPALYFSADSDAYEQLVRSVCVITGRTVEQARELVLGGRLESIRSELSGVPVRFEYETSPTVELLAQRVEAFWHLYGEYPSLIVADNITNVRTEVSEDEGNPFAGLEGLADYLHGMARGTESCLVALHHVNADKVNGDKPIALNGVKGQITRVPEMVLTLHRPYEGAIGVSRVKVRGGQADTSGLTYTELGFDGARMRITDLSRT